MLTTRIFRTALALTLALGGWGGGMAAPADGDHASITNFDQRMGRPRTGARAEQRAAQDTLRQRLPTAAADFDPALGTPKWVHARGGSLTGPGGEGGAVSRAAAQRFAKESDSALKSFLHEHRALFRHGAEVLTDAKKIRDHTSQGFRTTAWEQQVDGIPVFDSVLVAHTGAQGELISVSSLFVPEPMRAADLGTPGRAAKVRAPAITVEQALRLAVASVGETITNLTALEARPAAQTFKQRFRLKPLPAEAEASLVWLPLDGDTLRLGWQVELTRREFKERFRLVIDAQTGEVLVRRKLTVEISEVLYRVYTSDSPSPMSPGWATPTNTQPPYVPRQLLAISNVNATASPLGWINDGVKETRGNNVDAHLDRDSDDRADLPRPQATINGLGQRVFDFPLDLSLSPTNYSQASAVQLFYWCNWMHDKLYELGFTESAGNFQKDNFGRGGQDDDVILADVQDGSGFNNANFTPGRDGSPARIQMYLFNGPTPARDGDLDAEVICHEYAHGLSDRLVGGGVGLNFFGNIQSGGLGEGWSDFYGLALLAEPGDDLGGNYAVGGYLTWQFNGLQQNYYYGIRRYPYSTNLNIDPLTFKDIDSSTMSSHTGIPKNPIITSVGNEVHRSGEIWCSMLWDMRVRLLQKYAPTNATAYTNAHTRILRYVTDGMKLCPPNPSFAQARDAILTAVRNTPNSGTDENDVWVAFARRGLGLNAICPDSSITFGVVESFDSPLQPEFDVLPHLTTYVLSGPVGGPFLPSGVTNTLLNSTPTNLPWAAGVNVPWLQLSASGGVLPSGRPVTNFITVTPFASTLPAGTYQGNLFYTNLLRSQFVARAIFLTVQAVQPETLEVSPTSTYLAEGPTGGPFSPSQRVYQWNKTGATPFAWQAYSTNPWLTVSPTNGTLAATPDTTNITVTINSNANALAQGIYEGNITFVHSATGARVFRPVSLRVGSVDYFTEEFLGRPFDLSYSTLTFTPDLSPSFYRVCHESASVFPTDPAGGTPVPLADDEFRLLTLALGRKVSLYGTSNYVVYIGANGNVSLDPGSNTNFFYPGAFNHFAASRVSALYADLNPAAGGTVSYLQLTNRFVVTYDNVPEFGTANANNFQIEMFFDGALRLTWLRIDATNAGPVVGLARGTGVPGDFVQSDLSAFGGCLPQATLLLPLAALEGDGNVSGTLLLSAPSAHDLLVTLTSSDPNEVEVPASILVPAGQTSAPFALTPQDDGVPDGSQTVTITASFPDRPPVSSTIQIDDAQSASLTLNVTANGLEGAALSGGGTVTASVVVIRPLKVNLFSYNPLRASVPPSVIIPAGQSSASFDLFLPDNVLLDGAENVLIEATVANWSGDFDIIRVSDNESRALGLGLPLEITEGQPAVLGANVSFGGKTMTNVVIALQSDHPELIAVPALVTNLIGKSGVQFFLQIGDNSVTNSFDSVRIIASAPGFISATGTVMVVDDERPFAPLVPTPADLETHVHRDTPLGWMVNSHAPTGTIYDVYFGTNAPPGSNVIIASTSSFSLGLSLPQPLDPDTTYYWQVVARLAPFPLAPSPVWQFRTATFGYQMSAVGSPQFAGEPFPITVTAEDEYGLAVTNHSASLILTNSALGPNLATIVITEIDVNGIDRIEFANVSGRNVNIAGWKIATYDWQSWPAPRTVFTIPSPSMAKTNDVFQLRNFPLVFFPGTYPTFTPAVTTAWNNNVDNNPIAVLLLDSLGSVVDFVCAAGASPELITQPSSVPPAHWSSPPLNALLDSSLAYQRVGGRDQNNGSDWTYAPRSLGTNNLGLSVPFTNLIALAATVTPLNTFVSGVCTGLVTMLEVAPRVQIGVADTQGRGALSNPFDVLARNDLALTATAPDAVLVGDPFTSQFTITNTGPDAASGLTLSNALSTNSAFVSALASQGGCTFSNGVVTCALGSLDANTTAIVTIVATALGRGVVTNFTTLTRTGPDGYEANNSASTVTSATYPLVSIFDLTNAEPNTGTVTMTFSVRLSAPSTLTASVNYSTSDGTATGGVDYQPVAGVLVFDPGVTNRSIAVPINGDFLSESNETFFISLTSPTNANIVKGTSTGTITDNDGSPGLSVADATVIEGDVGAANMIFNVRLSAASGKIVSVGYATASGTALPGLDYQDSYGQLLFPPGMTNQTVSVSVFGDTIPEPAKTLFLNLSAAGNAVLTRPQAVGTILDNDLTPVNGFTIEPVTPTQYAGAALPVTITARDGNGAVAAGFNETVTLLALRQPRTNTIGTNTTTWNLPFNTSFHDARVQSIYLTNEVGPAGRILSLALDVATTPAQTLSNWTIRLRHTPSGSYTAALWEFINWQTNFQADVSVVSTGWVTFQFATPFLYNGQDNLLVDLSYNNSSFSLDGLSRSSVTALPRSLYLRTDSALGNPLDWLLNTPQPLSIARVPNLRLVLDRDAPLNPPVTGNFVNGVWTGNIVLTTAATNTQLRAVDRAGHTGDSNPFTLILLRISKITSIDGTVTLEFSTLAGSHYVVEGSASPGGGWSAVSPVLVGDGAVAQFSPLAAPSLQFFRVRVVP